MESVPAQARTRTPALQGTPAPVPWLGSTMPCRLLLPALARSMLPPDPGCEGASPGATQPPIASHQSHGSGSPQCRFLSLALKAPRDVALTSLALTCVPLMQASDAVVQHELGLLWSSY